MAFKNALKQEIHFRKLSVISQLWKYEGKKIIQERKRWFLRFPKNNQRKIDLLFKLPIFKKNQVSIARFKD